MTDKQIIIDGVDISECKNFSCGKCEEENKIPRTINHFTADCRMYPNCYYKQLTRKEQECNKLYIQLKADEEYYKEEENTLRKIIKNKEERNIELYKENNKLKQTLTEIKELADWHTTSADSEDIQEDMKQILQKISECEAKNEHNG